MKGLVCGPAAIGRLILLKNCVFCQIIAGERPGKIIYKDDQVTAFLDNHPVTSTHILIVPNKHLSSMNDINEIDEPLIGHLFLVAKKIAIQEGIAETGYKLIVNTGRGAGQSVFHLHVHLIGGGRMPHLLGGL